MQHYMDDLQDLVEGLEEEVGRRLMKIRKLDSAVKEMRDELKKLEQFVCNEAIPKEDRKRKALEAADLMCQMRYATEKKVIASTGIHKIVSSIFGKIRDVTYNCKMELEVDNPGCAQERENLFFEMYGVPVTTDHSRGLIGALPIASLDSGRQTRENSRLHDDDMDSIASDFSRAEKRGVGRPKGGILGYRNTDSARSSMERDLKKKSAPMSTYLRKKHEKAREQKKLVEAYERRKKKDVKLCETIPQKFCQPFIDVKRERMDSETPSNSADFDGGLWKNDGDDLDLLNLFPSTLPSPPREMKEIMESFDDSFGFDTMMQSENVKFRGSVDENVGKHSMMSSPSTDIGGYERKKKAMLFSNVPETSFHGRPRKFTDRASEMIQQTRAREERRKKEEDGMELWCYCRKPVEGADMVCCDYENCNIKWYHFECVNLKEAPAGTWYCPTCLRNAREGIY